MSAATHPDFMLQTRSRDISTATAASRISFWGSGLRVWWAWVICCRLSSSIDSGSHLQHNFRSDLSTHETVQRVYALNDEAGLLARAPGRMAADRNTRSRMRTRYGPAIEYQVAAHCIYEGLIDEGLAIVRGVRDRHDGAKRNPWNEFECGHHYARAMSSWSLILALSGYHYDAARRHLKLVSAGQQARFPMHFHHRRRLGRLHSETRFPRLYGGG